MSYSLSRKAEDFARFEHSVIRQYYGKRAYDFHLELTHKVADRFLELLVAVQPDVDIEKIKAALWCHDLIEDSHRVNFNTLKKLFGLDVAELVFAVSENKGRNRKERHDDDYYQGIAKDVCAVFIKLCDTSANVLTSVFENNSMFFKYKEEYPNYKLFLFHTELAEMFWFLENLFNHNSLTDYWRNILDELAEKYPEIN